MPAWAAAEWGEQDSNLRRQCQGVYSAISFNHSDIPPSGADRRCRRASASRIVRRPHESRHRDKHPSHRGRPNRAPALYGEAARIITDALLHDPGWLAVGPSNTAHRRVVARVYHRAAIGVMDRHGGPIYGAFRDGRLVGVAATFAAGLYPPPARTFFSYVPGFLLAGPAPIVRGLRVSAVQDGGHPQEPHVFLWFLAVDPEHQRRGIGRALLQPGVRGRPAPPSTWTPTTPPTSPTTRASASRRSAAATCRAGFGCGL